MHARGKLQRCAFPSLIFTVGLLPSSIVHKNNYVEDGTFTLITASYTRNKESEGEAATIATPPECWTKAVLAHAGIRGRESLSDIPGYDQIEDRALKKSVDVRIHALFRKLV